MPTRQILRSRYHSEFPITAKNPLTNEVIVGEIHFYLLEEGTTAKFFGTDFSYATSKDFRASFLEMTKEKALCDVGLRQENEEN